jgi:hypothetical protein
MGDHDGQNLTPREMVRAHAYPMLAAVSTVALVVIAASLAPIALHADPMNRCLAALGLHHARTCCRFCLAPGVSRRSSFSLLKGDDGVAEPLQPP